MFCVPVVTPPIVNPPLVPASVCCFSTMLMMPATPVASSRAEGFETTSIVVTTSAGSCARKLPSCPPFSGLGRPLIWMITPELPRKLTMLSMSTSTDGTLRSTSSAVPPRTLGMSWTTYAFRSGASSTSARRSRTTTEFNATATGISATVPASTVGAAVPTVTWAISRWANPMAAIRTRYVPGRSPCTRKRPSVPATARLSESAAPLPVSSILAAPTGACVSALTTRPRISPRARVIGEEGVPCAAVVGAIRTTATSDSANERIRPTGMNSDIDMYDRNEEVAVPIRVRNCIGRT